jgi:hypothetical protein
MSRTIFEDGRLDEMGSETLGFRKRERTDALREQEGYRRFSSYVFRLSTEGIRSPFARRFR